MDNFISKKKKFSYKDIVYKSKRLAVLGLVVVFGVGALVTAKMTAEIPVHDGDVLVDSLAVSEEKAELTGKKTSANGQPLDFKSMRASLELERNKLLANYDKTINDSKNENEKNNASKEKERIMGYMEQELAIESKIKSKDLPDTFVVITENNVTATVDKQELDTNTVAKICDIIMRETGKTADKIVVQSKY